MIEQELTELRQELKTLRLTMEDLNALQSPLIGIKQVAQGLGKSNDTISRWVKNRVISCYKIPNGKGHVYLFSWRQLEDDLNDYAQPRL